MGSGLIALSKRGKDQVPDENGDVVLLVPRKEVPVGGRMF